MWRRVGNVQRLSLACALLAALGCEDEGPSAARAPGSGVSGSPSSPAPGGGPGPAGGSDSGTGADPDDDAGMADMADAAVAAVDGGSPAPDYRILASECRTLDAADFVGEDTPIGGFFTGVSVPDDFSVTRIQSVWEDDCGDPTFRVTLSEGRCPDGRGQELVFWFNAAAVRDGEILIGQNAILGTDSKIQVRYRRPGGTGPTGEWGTCALATGTIDMVGELNLEEDTELQARFQMELTACDEMTSGLQTVQGTFSALIRRELTDICPDATP